MYLCVASCTVHIPRTRRGVSCSRGPGHRVPLDNRVKEKWRTEAKSSGSRDSFPGRLGRLGAVMPDAPDAPHLPDKTDCTAFVPFATLITCILLVTVAVAARTRRHLECGTDATQLIVRSNDLRTAMASAYQEPDSYPLSGMGRGHGLTSGPPGCSFWARGSGSRPWLFPGMQSGGLSGGLAAQSITDVLRIAPP